MPELTHHSAEDGFHEIQLSGKQLVFLFMATTVVSVVIFLCGVLVGRGVRAERGEEDPQTTAAAPAPPTDAATSAGPPATEPPAPPADAELSYDKRLRGQNPDDRLSSQPAESKPAAEPPAPAQAPPASAEQPSTAEVPRAGRSGGWVVQVHALQNQDAASAFVRSLSSKGYPAFLVTPEAGSPQLYRVQIGGYPDRRDAEQVARRLEKEEQFKPAIKRR